MLTQGVHHLRTCTMLRARTVLRAFTMLRAHAILTGMCWVLIGEALWGATRCNMWRAWMATQGLLTPTQWEGLRTRKQP